MLSVRVDPASYKALKERADKERVTVSSLVWRLLGECLPVVEEVKEEA